MVEEAVFSFSSAALVCNLNLKTFLKKTPQTLHNSCGPMMLDVLFKIKDEQDTTLAFRRSCR